MNIIQTEIHIGIEQPFTVLQITDTHLVMVGDSESEARREFGRDRSVYDKREDLDFAREYAATTGYPLIHTGDLMDFLTPESMEVSRRFARETGLLMVAGNHEQCYCPGNRFHEDDYAEELKVREATLDHLQTCFDNNVRFFCKEINGVCLVGLDDGDYQITEAQLEAFKQVEALGKPIILFVHIPFYDDDLGERFADCMVGTPGARMGNYNAWQIYEQTAKPTTRRAYEYIMASPLLKAIVSGHMHASFENKPETCPRQFVTGLRTMREITVR